MFQLIPAIPAFVKQLSPRGLIWEMPIAFDTEPAIYITFDDGPVPEVTPDVLRILRKYNARATFFCVGDNVRKNHDVYRQILNEGHSTGNHSFSHLKGFDSVNDAYYNDIARCAELVDSKLLRPPYGRIKLSQIRRLRKDYKIIMWTVITGDYDKRLSKEQVLANAVNHTKPGAIIVFHDSIKSSERMLWALPRYLEHFAAKGYNFKAIL